jgi:hypothetical protein
MLELDDFYDDQIILRQVKRQAAEAAAELEEEDMEDEDDDAPPSAQQQRSNRQLGDSDGDVEENKKSKMKAHKQRISRDPNRNRVASPDE